MPVRLNISLAGDVQIDRELLRMRNAVVDARPAFEKIALMISQFTVKHFASEGGGGAGGRWSSGHWAPLSPPYRAWKAEHFPGQPILVRTGALRRDLTNSPMGVQTITSDTMTVGTDIPYAAFHQQGTPRMPRRRVLDLDTATRTEMVKVLQRWVATGSL